MTTRRALGLAAVLGTRLCSADPQYIIVGSGACDGQDKHCDDKSPEKKADEKKMSFLTIDEDGQLVSKGDLSSLPGLAAWFAVKPATSANGATCVFIAYPDASAIMAQMQGHEVPHYIQTVTLDDHNANPVFIDVSSDGNSLIAANYHGPDDGTNSTGASVQTFSIADDCKLTLADLKPHDGSSVNKARQGAAHPHSTVAGRNGLVFVCDLGMDVIFTYSISSTGMLKELARTPTPAGSGPRHSVQHPTEDVLFVVSEMGSDVSSYRIEASGALTKLDSKTTLASNDPQEVYGSKAAEIAMSADGRHLYASNRAFSDDFRNTIAVFDISSDFKLTATQQMDCPKYPRGMMLMPDGKFLLVASQTNGEVASFSVDSATGHLTATKSTANGPWGASAFAALPAPRARVVVV